MNTPRLAHHRGRRSGLTLLEVILALAIFFMALVVLGRLVTMGTDHAQNVKDKARSLQVCQGILAELSTGGRSLTSGDSGTIDGDDNWKWEYQKPDSTDINSDLYKVTIKVTRTETGGDNTEEEIVTVSQFIFDPAKRGTAPTPLTPPSLGTDSSGDGSGSGQGTGGGTQGVASGGGGGAGGKTTAVTSGPGGKGGATTTKTTSPAPVGTSGRTTPGGTSGMGGSPSVSPASGTPKSSPASSTPKSTPASSTPKGTGGTSKGGGG